MNKSYSKSQLAKLYNVSYNTIMKWLKDIPQLNLSPKQRIFTPKQIEIIFNELGKP